MEGLSFESAVTPAGALVVGATIKVLVDLLRGTIPPLASMSGALIAFILSAIFYVIAAIALTTLDVPMDANDYLNVFLTWLTAATTAVGFTSVIRHATGNPEQPGPPAGPPPDPSFGTPSSGFTPSS